MNRHGARSSHSNLKTNVPKDHFGKGVGNGELTTLGRLQHHNLGLQRRREYIHEKEFLSPNYDIREIVSLSTYRSRCVYSGNSFWQAMYPF